MRKITQQAAEAFAQGRPFESGNTRVTVEHYDDESRVTRLCLHGSSIATWGRVDRRCPIRLFTTMAGRPSAKTRGALNTALAVCFDAGLIEYPASYAHLAGRQYVHANGQPAVEVHAADTIEHRACADALKVARQPVADHA